MHQVYFFTCWCRVNCSGFTSSQTHKITYLHVVAKKRKVGGIICTMFDPRGIGTIQSSLKICKSSIYVSSCVPVSIRWHAWLCEHFISQSSSVNLCARLLLRTFFFLKSFILLSSLCIFICLCMENIGLFLAHCF